MARLERPPALDSGRGVAVAAQGWHPEARYVLLGGLAGSVVGAMRHAS